MNQSRTYNPLTEGYSGLLSGNEGYSGNNTLSREGYKGGNSHMPPQTIKPLQSAIIKPATTPPKQQS